MNCNDLIALLDLKTLDEGGYYRQTYESEWHVDCPERPGVRRSGLNTIYYLLTTQSPIGCLHRNRSDIVHYFQGGSPLEYVLVAPSGDLQICTVGPDLGRNHLLQMVVPGGVWKATELRGGDYGLISEAVAPGFDIRDRDIGTADEIRRLFPALWPLLERYVHQAEPP